MTTIIRLYRKISKKNTLSEICRKNFTKKKKTEKWICQKVKLVKMMKQNLKRKTKLQLKSIKKTRHSCNPNKFRKPTAPLSYQIKLTLGIKIPEILTKRKNLLLASRNFIIVHQWINMSKIINNILKKLESRARIKPNQSRRKKWSWTPKLTNNE